MIFSASPLWFLCVYRARRKPRSSPYPRLFLMIFPRLCSLRGIILIRVYMLQGKRFIFSCARFGGHLLDVNVVSYMIFELPFDDLEKGIGIKGCEYQVEKGQITGARESETEKARGSKRVLHDRGRSERTKNEAKMRRSMRGREWKGAVPKGERKRGREKKRNGCGKERESRIDRVALRGWSNHRRRPTSSGSAAAAAVAALLLQVCAPLLPFSLSASIVPRVERDRKLNGEHKTEGGLANGKRGEGWGRRRKYERTDGDDDDERYAIVQRRWIRRRRERARHRRERERETEIETERKSEI